MGQSLPPTPIPVLARPPQPNPHTCSAPGFSAPWGPDTGNCRLVRREIHTWELLLFKEKINEKLTHIRIRIYISIHRQSHMYLVYT